MVTKQAILYVTMRKEWIMPAVSTAKDLAKKTGTSLGPSLGVLSKVIRSIGENGIQVEREATRALYELISETYLKLDDADGHKVAQVFKEAFDNANDRQQVGIQKALEQVGQVASINEDAKLKIILDNIAASDSARCEEIREIGKTHRSKKRYLGIAAIVLAAGWAWKTARKPSFIESIFGKK